jgi:hypothetical protein
MFKNVDWNATGTMALAVIAFASFWVQIVYSRKQLQESRQAFDRSLATQREVSNNEIAVRLYLQFIERWDSPRMVTARKSMAAHFLLNHSDSAVREEVLNYFEDIDGLFEQGRVDQHLTYETLSYFSKGWWFACKPYVLRLRANKGDATLFTKFEDFADLMLGLEATERGLDKRQLVLNDQLVGEFLQEERDLG